MLFTILCNIVSLYCLCGLVFFYYQKRTCIYYDHICHEYLRLLRKHNYCNCHTFNSTNCNTLYQIKELEDQRYICKKDIHNIDWLIHKWTCGYIEKYYK